MSKNQENQIHNLNAKIKVKIGVSKVHGVGVITICRIEEGERVWAQELPRMYSLGYSSMGQLFPEVRKLLLERNPAIINGSGFIMPDAIMIDYMNHSQNPNYDAKTDTALRRIGEGEEVSEDYTLMQNYEKVWPDLESWNKYDIIKENL